MKKIKVALITAGIMLAMNCTNVLAESEAYTNVIKDMSAFENVSVSENSATNGKKLLGIYLYAANEDFNTESNAMGEKLNAVIDTVAQESEKEWFDFDVVAFDVWNENYNRVLSTTVNIHDLNNTQTYDWGFKNESTITEQAQDSENSVLYQDENLIITYDGISGEEDEYEVKFVIENLSHRTLTIQARETSINGFMVDPMCSMEVAPGKKVKDGMRIWLEDAETTPMSEVQNIETKFHIFDFDDMDYGYDTENIIIK